MRSVYIICAKCGSDDILFINQEYTPEEQKDPDYGSGICMVCSDCSTMTSVEEFNEYKLGGRILVDEYRTPMTIDEVLGKE